MNKEKLVKVWKEKDETIFLWRHGASDYSIEYDLLDFSLRGTYKDVKESYEEIFEKPFSYDFRSGRKIKRFEELVQLLLENNDYYYDCREMKIVDDDTLYFILGNMEITVSRSEEEKLIEYIDEIKNR